MKKFLKKIIFPHSYSSEAYVAYLRSNGVLVGEDTIFYSPNKTSVDIRKPWIIKIGDHCKITEGVTILAHDYSIAVTQRVYGPFAGGSLPVTIGSNVFVGMNAIILMGTTIGNNCIIGANSVVKGTFPDGVVVAGNPAKVICTIEEYHKRNIASWVERAKRVAKAIYANKGSYPTVKEMSDGYAWLYLPKTKESIEKYPGFFQLTGLDTNELQNRFLEFEAPYKSFEEFLADCFKDN